MASSKPLPSSLEIAAWKEEVYDACVPFAKDNPKIIFHQADLFDMDIIPNDDLQILLTVTQLLLDEKLFKVVHNIEGMGWKLRTVDEAKKYIPKLQIEHS
jgi:DNA-directed RNA polymerase III subunit RPC6